MPNHITNRIQFSGKREDIDRVLALIKGDNECIDFEKIIPMPNNIYRGDLDQRARALYGKNNWYDWRRTNWGTKWNAYWSSIDNENNTIILWFDTAWSCPIPVLNKLAEICCINDVRFEGEWADEDCGCNVGVFWSDNCVDKDYDFYYESIDDNTDEAYDIYVKLKCESDCVGKDGDGHWVRYDCDTCPNKDKC